MDERTTAQYWWTGGLYKIKFAELAVRPDTGLYFQVDFCQTGRWTLIKPTQLNQWLAIRNYFDQSKCNI